MTVEGRADVEGLALCWSYEGYTAAFPLLARWEERNPYTASVIAHVEEDQEAQGPAPPFEGEPRQASEHGPLTPSSTQPN